jgi:hypothetical protein
MLSDKKTAETKINNSIEKKNRVRGETTQPKSTRREISMGYLPGDQS